MSAPGTAWDALRRHHARVRRRPILSLFDADPNRAADFSIGADGLLLDWSKTNIDAEGRALLLELAEATDVAARRRAMFAGARINETEGRAVLHVALRAGDDAAITVDGQDVMPGVRAMRARMGAFAEAVRTGRLAVAGGPVADVVSIGIGGSDLGPAMAAQALSPFHDGPRVHFISNIDGAHLHDTLLPLDPRRTLVIVVSKTFTTAETMANAEAARRWMAQAVADPAGQFAAVSSADERAARWGIAPDRVFGFADWVGGRFSVWGPVGLALMIAIGTGNFARFLAGARAMDAHFLNAPAARNLPVILALTGIWHNQICGHASRAVLPYEQRLARLPAYLQQLDMESNGKRVTLSGRRLGRHSAPVIWGEPGTNGQHAFHQFLHQGTRITPCEFLVAREGHEPDLAAQHRLLVANCLAQSAALLRGRSLAEARALVHAAGHRGAAAERLARHRTFPGNRPSVTLAFGRLEPFTLGQIIALYEHRVMVEGAILGINSFDQWGVELGKELALSLAPLLNGKDVTGIDGSTAALARFLRAPPHDGQGGR